MEKSSMIKNSEITKVVLVTGGTNQPTVKRELMGEELEKWRAEHGYTTEVQTESDPE